MRAGLEDDFRVADGVAGGDEPVETLRQRLLAVDVFLGLGGGRQVRRVLVIARGNGDGIHVLQGQQVAVRREGAGVSAVPFLALGGGHLPTDLPRVGDGRDLDVLGLGVLVDTRHMGAQPPAAASDDADRHPIIGPGNAGITGGRHREGGAGRGGLLEKTAAG